MNAILISTILSTLLFMALSSPFVTSLFVGLHPYISLGARTLVFGLVLYALMQAF